MSLPLKSEIVRYWYEEYIRYYKENRLKDIPDFVKRFAIDIGEPVCWGCGRFSDSWDYEGWTGKPRVRDRIFRNWDRLPLERSHLIPQSRGGTDEPNNLVLLCSDCHRDAPDFVNPMYMIKWLNNRSYNWMQQIIYQWKSLCEIFGVTPKEMMRRLRYVVLHERDKFDEFRAEKSTHHFNSYALATLFACIKEYGCNEIE